MKAILVFVCFTACVTIAICLSCRAAEDCDKLSKDPDKKEFCCMAADFAALEGRGSCVRLTREGLKCHKEDAKVDYYGDKFIRYCPCADGLSCEPKADKNFTDPAGTRQNLRCKKEEKKEGDE